MKIVTVIQARRGSSRLPNKVMLPILGESLLVRMVERVLAAPLTGTVVVATTLAADDDVIAELCATKGWECYRGSTDDLLDRHYQAGLIYGAEVVIKIPSDCPLIDPQIIETVIQNFLSGDYDYYSNLHPATFPDGNDVEIMRFSALQNAWKNAVRSLEREHTTPYFWENPEKFKIGNYVLPGGQNYSMTHRFTIDYEADYQFIAAVYQELYPTNPLFSMEDILALLAKKQNIYALNAEYAGVNWYRNHLNELKTIQPTETKQAPTESLH